MEPAEEEPTEEAIEEARAQLDAHITENADGMLIIRLVAAVDVDGAPVTRATMRRVKVRDVRAARNAAEEDRLELLAEVLCGGIYDDLESDFDRLLLLRAADKQLGKYLAHGSPP